MSRKSDIRMHVEHLFEGRTLTKETIELKEEIYSNLVARYEDYVAQGMGDDEAYRRTCEAVGSLDDVLGGEGEKDEEQQSAPAEPADVAADETVVAPVVDGAPEPPAEGAAASPEATVSAPKKRWSTPAIVIAAVVAVLLVGTIVVTVLNIVNTNAARDAYEGMTSEEVQPQDVDDSTSYEEPGTNAEQDSSTTTQTTPQSTQNGAGEQNRGGQGQGNRDSASATGLDAEVYAHSADSLTAATLASSGSSAVENVTRSLPLAEYLTSVEATPANGTATITYTYQDRDRVAYDDDCVDRALVYNVVALMSTVSDLDRVELIEIEDDGYDYDRDRQVFDRATVEGILGIPLNADLLAADVWNATRDQVMTKRYWDPIWESADVD